MPRRAACLSCHQRKVKCHFQPGSTQCSPCACNGTRCVKLSSRQGQRSDLIGAKSPARLPSIAVQHPDLRSPELLQHVESDAGQGSNGTERDDQIEVLFNDEMNREILLPNSNQAAPPVGNEEFKGGMWYLGEANFAWLLLNQPQCRHYPVFQPVPPTASPLRNQGVAKTYPSSLRSQEVKYLESIKAFSRPKSPQLEIFVKVFFSQVSPRLPVLSYLSFSVDAVNRLMQSPLLVQSMLFASARFLSLDIIHALGYKDQRDAQNSFYRKAKALFDFDQEQQQLHRLQSSILLASEWNVFVNEKDPDEWTGRALRIAHRMGIHRNIRNPSINESTRALYRRIWWTIYKMERNLSMATGRPSHIFDQDGDVAWLSEADFQSFDNFGDNQPQNQSESYDQQKSWINYQVRSCELWKIAGEFKASAHQASESLNLCYKNIDYNLLLDDWTQRANSVPRDAQGCSSPWDLNLDLLYHLVRCLVNQPIGNTQAPSLESPGKAMCNAALKINQLAEQIVLQYPNYPYPYFLPIALKISSFTLILQAATTSSPSSRNFTLHRVGSAQLTLQEVLKQIPSSARLLRTIRNAQATLENYQAQQIKNSRGNSTTDYIPAESSTLVENTEVLQDSRIPQAFDSVLFDTLWSGDGLSDFPISSEDFALHMFDWPSAGSDMSWTG